MATRAAKKEYSGELCSQNDSKMEPKMDPKVAQKGSPLKNTKKQIWTTIYYTMGESHKWQNHRQRHEKRVLQQLRATISQPNDHCICILHDVDMFSEHLLNTSFLRQITSAGPSEKRIRCEGLQCSKHKERSKLPPLPVRIYKASDYLQLIIK